MEHRPSEARLILDSIGPSLTKHYLVLSAIGVKRLHQLREIHAFSGGVFAYFGFHGILYGKMNHSLEVLLARKSEAALRRCHHPSLLSPLRALHGLLFRQTAFGTVAPLVDTLNYIFTTDHLEKRLEDFPPNIKIYLGVKGKESPIGVSLGTLPFGGSEANGLQNLPIRDLVAMACAVPYIYGLTGRGDQFFDAASTKGYLNALGAIVKEGSPTLVSTPWRQGKKGNIVFVNCYGHRSPKRRVLIDVMKLLLNLPNRDWAQDIAAAFLLNCGNTLDPIHKLANQGREQGKQREVGLL